MLLKTTITRGFQRLHVLNKHQEIRVLYKTGGAKMELMQRNQTANSMGRDKMKKLEAMYKTNKRLQ